jgi:hypothetical protein
MKKPANPKVVLSLVLGAITLLRGSAAAAPGAADLPSVDQLPVIGELPDPFLMKDGSRVKTAADWTRRREELKNLIQYYEYGHLPPPLPVTARELSSGKNEALGATEKHLVLAIASGGKKVEYHLDLTIPLDKPGPLPVIVKGDLAWGKVTVKASENAVKEIVRRGYILAEFNREEVAPDKDDRTTGVYTLYPDCDWGAEAAWAWGFHRTIDYLLTLACVDRRHIAVTGHSRGGKAALLAGAMDERIALTAPNGSGCGGAGSCRVRGPKSEGIENILKKFPFWFHPRFKDFIGKENRLPFDQHSVKALVAPRALVSTEGLGDLWANPEGTQATYLAAREVFRFLGAEEKIGIHFREGKHEQNETDWMALLDFADKVFFGKTGTRKFDQPAFPDSGKQFSWSAPAAAEGK